MLLDVPIAYITAAAFDTDVVQTRYDNMRVRACSGTITLSNGDTWCFYAHMRVDDVVVRFML